MNNENKWGASGDSSSSENTTNSSWGSSSTQDNGSSWGSSTNDNEAWGDFSSSSESSDAWASSSSSGSSNSSWGESTQESDSASSWTPATDNNSDSSWGSESQGYADSSWGNETVSNDSNSSWGETASSSSSSDSSWDSSSSSSTGWSDTSSSWGTSSNNSQSKESVKPGALSREEQLKYLERLNQDADNKHYILFFGTPSSGKSYIIGSLVNHIETAYGHDITYLRNEYEADTKYYLNLRDAFTQGKEIVSTSYEDWYELSFKIRPQDRDPYEIVFVDACGEFTRDSVLGSLPDQIKLILQSKVKTSVCFVFDYNSFKKKQGTESENQVNCLSSVYQIIRDVQDRKDKQFKKVLLFSKSDLFRKEYDTSEHYISSGAFALDKIPGFAKNFSMEKNPDGTHLNSAMFYYVAEFDDLAGSVSVIDTHKINTEAPKKLLDWIFGIKPEVKKESFLTRLFNIFG